MPSDTLHLSERSTRWSTVAAMEALLLTFPYYAGALLS